jgi:hypothetical protein
MSAPGRIRRITFCGCGTSFCRRAAHEYSQQCKRGHGDLQRCGGCRSQYRSVAQRVLANTRDRNTTVKLSIRGFPILRAATLHVLDEPRVIRQSVALPKSPVQTIVLRPYSVAVVQFIEPPKR